MPWKLKLLVIFSILLSACQNNVQDKTIGIQLFDAFSQSELIAITDAISDTYGCKVKTLKIVSVPESYITTIKSFRYRADSILNYLEAIKPDSIDIMLGLTNTDIAITKIDQQTGKTKTPVSTYTDWAIFGLGRINGHSCVVSNHRLKKNVSKKQYIKRLTRICNHEIGHVLGLPHCPIKNCLMNDANETISTIDQSSGILCHDCRRQIN